MKPYIGISTGITASRYYAPNEYVKPILESGGIPILIPSINLKDDENIILATHMLSRVDGVLFIGGGDIEPSFYGEHRMTKLSRVFKNRDAFDLALAKVAIKEDLPVLGICRGCQVLNISGGGTLRQGIKSHWQELPRDKPMHLIRLNKDTRLFEIFREEELMVNSFHRQAIRELAFGFDLSAYADDGIVEGIENNQKRFLIGVQFHPEDFFDTVAPIRRLFASFINACKGAI